VDYSGKELVTWAQVCLWVAGFSNLAEVLNSGGDPHLALGADLAGISVEEALALTGDAKKEFKNTFRQLGKIGNFGLQGGMGPDTLRIQARKTYRVRLTDQEARGLVKAWKARWTENEPYFQWVNQIVERGGPVEQFRSGRIRANCSYTQGANTMFQGLAADSAKAAGYELARECYSDPESPLYGCRPVWFVHDEWGLEVPDHPERAHLAAMRHREIMVQVAQAWVPDVQVRAEPTLARRWYKEAEPVYENGMLVPWEPTK